MTARIGVSYSRIQRPCNADMGREPYLGDAKQALVLTMNVSETAQQKAQNWTEQARNWQSRAGEVAKNFGTATDRYVHENTWATVGVAALVGCVIGYLLASWRDRD